MASFFSLRRLFVWGNFLLLVLFLISMGQDQVRGWKGYQKEYKKLEVTRVQQALAEADTEDDKARLTEELKAAKRFPMEIRQIVAPDFEAVERCITCHLGYDPIANPGLSTPYDKHPFRAEDGSAAQEIHRLHAVDRFACTVCHGGQGTATEVKAAHGEVLHWESPLRKGALMQAACAKCHDNVAELQIKGKPYATEIVRAKKLFHELGCIGCHQVAGEGGPISVDLKEETSAKPLSRIDFAASGLPHEEWTLANWIRIHFVRDPAELVPGDPKGEFNTEPIAPSAMPPYLLSDQDADALTAYIMGLNRNNLQPEYLVRRPPEPEPQFASSVQHGRYVYEKFGCAACHGPEGRGGIRNFNYQYGTTPNLRRAASTYTRDELREKISEGVAFLAKNDPKGPQPPLYMPSWKAKIKGAELEDLVTYLQSIRE